MSSILLASAHETRNGAYALRQGVKQDNRQTAWLIAPVCPCVICSALDKDITEFHCDELLFVKEHVYFAFNTYDVIDGVGAVQIGFIAWLKFHHRESAAAEGRG